MLTFTKDGATSASTVSDESDVNAFAIVILLL